MNKNVRNYLIPNEENNYEPHALQKFSIAVMLVLMLLSFAIANIQSVLWINSDWLVGAVLPSVIVDLTNQERTSDALITLRRSAILDTAAQLKASDMAVNGYFAHTSPDGKSPWYWFDKAGYNFVYAGENLAVHFADSNDVVAAWMDSQEHRANILNSNYTEIGVGTAKGTYKGVSTVFVVQLFGTPAANTTPAFAAVGTNTQEYVVITKASTTVLGAVADTPKESTSASVAENDPHEASAIYSDLATTSRQGTPADLRSDGGVGSENVGYQPNVLDQVAVQPKLWLQMLYGLLALFVFIALVLSIVIEWRRQHPTQIAYGFALLGSMMLLFFLHVAITGGAIIA